MKQGFNFSKLPLIIGAALIASSINVSANEVSSMVIKNQTNNGSPSFVVGELGSATSKTSNQVLKSIINSQNEFGAQGNEDFQVRRQWVDELGKSHTHFDQTINGIKVYGTSMIMHGNTSVGVLSLGNEESTIYGVTGRLANNDAPVVASTRKGKKAKRMKRKVIAAAKKIGKVLSKPELSYVYLPLTEETKLSYRIEVSYDSDTEGFGRDFIYYDAINFEIISREPQVHSAKSWRTHTLNGGPANSAPGRLLCTNNQGCGNNAAAQRAHDGASKVYDYYKSKFNRDSLDNNGMTLVSSVDMGVSNAYWTGYQMIYGEASNGLNDFTSDFDIIGHELTHGVTSNTAGLIYANASGALNEAWSDILGVTSEAYKNGASSPSWYIGDGLYNNQPGKAFRYMSNPTQDGRSKDWWPERFPYTNNPNKDNDQGGVHLNSGIANLAFVLLVDGGTHPRNKSTAQVPSIGMAKAEQIFYRALTTYMNQNTNFSGARTATAQAAQDLYGATEKFAVETAWCAVGVGTCPTGGGGPIDPPTGNNVLQNGVAKTSLSASTGNDIVFTMNVPDDATDINFVSSGGTGDADMYVKFGSTPTDSSYDCRPYKGGNNESCSGTSTGGTYYVRLKAYQSFSGVSLTGSYTADTTPPGGGNTPINDQLSNVNVAGGQWNRFTQVLPAGYSDMTISINGGFGDADLYIRHGAASTSTSYDCRPWKNGNNESCSFSNPAAGTWYIDIYGYQSASGITLTLQANP